MIRGGCLCGAVRYAIDGPCLDIGHCHCSMCRRVHGAAFGTYATVRREEFRWTAGAEGALRRYASSPGVERGFCGRCGATLSFDLLSRRRYLEVAVGTFDEDPGARPTFHIFVGSKAPWHEIADDLPQWEGDLVPEPGEEEA